MDSITQILLGTSIAEAGFRQKLGGRAVIAGAVLGLLPDLDIVTRLGRPWAFLKYHRGPTHSLVVLALVSPLIGWMLWRLSRKRGSPGRWILLSGCVLLTHPLLDCCTSYGTQLLWPLTTRRFSVDAIAIVDPVYTLPLLLATAFACVPRIRRFSRTFAICVLVATTGYIGFGRVQMQRARALAAKQFESEGFQTVRVRAMPMIMADNLLWHVAARDRDGGLRVGTISTWAPRHIRFHRLDPPDGALARKALESEQGRLFVWFADGLVSTRVEREGPQSAVILSDHRYGTVTEPAKSIFTARALFDADNRLIEVRLSHRNRDIDFRKELSVGWKLLKGEPTDAEE